MKKIFKKIIAAILRVEARLTLAKFHPHIVAVTGSVGKTSTKDAIFVALASCVRARKSEKSFNSEIGVPLTVLGLHNAWTNPVKWAYNIVRGCAVILAKNSYPAWLVLEVGADRPGDIESLARWIRPHIAVLTRFPDTPVHVEFFGTPEDVVKEKMSLVRYVKEGGALVVNADDPTIMKNVSSGATRKITYGFSDGADVRGDNYAIEYEDRDGSHFPVGFSFDVTLSGEKKHLFIRGGLGMPHAYALLAALAVVVAARADHGKAIAALMDHVTPPGRMRLIQGIRGSLIIDDSYNSSPASLEKAIETVLSLSSGEQRKIAVLGDMLELGKYSVREHEKVGDHVTPFDIVITVGPRARAIADVVKKKERHTHSVFTFQNSDKAAAYVAHLVQKGDIVLVKGSQGARMEKVAKAIMGEPDQADSLLVRQDKEWLG